MFFKACPTLTIPNGTLNDTVRTCGTVLHLTCGTGHVLVGDGIVTCDPSGGWNHASSCQINGNQIWKTARVTCSKFALGDIKVSSVSVLLFLSQFLKLDTWFNKCWLDVIMVLCLCKYVARSNQQVKYRTAYPVVCGSGLTGNTKLVTW